MISLRLRSMTGPVIVVGANLILIVIGAYFLESASGAPNLANMIRATLIYIALSSIICLLTGRLIYATCSATILIFLVAAVSKIKFSFVHVNLRTTDLLLISPTETVYFVQRAPQVSAIVAFGFIGCLAASYWLFRKDRARPVRVASTLSLVLAIFAVQQLQARREVNVSGAYYDTLHMSSFFSSIPEAVSILQGARLPYAAAKEAGHVSSIQKVSYLDGNLEAQVSASPPNVIIILHESAVNPARFVSDPRYSVQSDMFISQDGVERRLGVETYGGGTWISEYGLLLGVSTRHFGAVGSILGIAPHSHFRNALPARLRSLGFRTTAIYPSDKRFAGTDSLYRTLGFQRIYDDAIIGSDRESPDSVYYEFVLSDLARRRRSGDVSPSFYFVITSLGHFPYDEPLARGTRSAEIVPGDPWSEYSRRLRISRDDLTRFESQLASAFPKERFVVAGFGDHQPFLTGNGEKGASKVVLADREMQGKSGLLETFYRVRGIRYRPHLERIPQRLEIGLLSTAVMMAAGLPLDQSYAHRAGFLSECRGLLFLCSDHDSVMALYRRLVLAGDFPGIPVDAMSCSEVRSRGLRCDKPVNIAATNK